MRYAARPHKILPPIRQSKGLARCPGIGETSVMDQGERGLLSHP